MLWRKIRQRGEVFARGRMKDSLTPNTSITPMISMYTWGKMLNWEVGRQPRFQLFFTCWYGEFISQHFLSEVLQGAKTLPRAKFGLNSVLFFARWLLYLNSLQCFLGGQFAHFECRELWMIDLEPFCCFYVSDNKSEKMEETTQHLILRWGMDRQSLQAQQYPQELTEFL